MSTAFAALEAKVNAATLSHLSNAVATMGESSFDGVFDADWLDVLGTDGAKPTFLAGQGVLSGVANGATLAITCTPLSLDAAPYTVVSRQPEHGLTRLILRRTT
jgi:hypothetical protein